jgi:glycosyltransferase involved in cell wall biosynthesis
MRVLQVIPSVAQSTGGPAVFAVQIARVLGSRGIENTIYSTDLAYPAQTSSSQRVTPDEMVSGASAVDLQLFPVRQPYRFAYSPGLARALRQNAGRYDVVHFHSIFLHPGVAAYRAARRAGVPYLISLHGSLDPWQRRRRRLRKMLVNLAWVKSMLASAAVIHVDTDEEARRASDVVPGVPRVIVPPGIDWAELQELPPPAEFRSRYLNGHDGPVVLNVARIAENKGHDLLIRAFATIAGDRPDARLVFVGPDNEGRMEGLVRLASEQGVRDRVVFTGMVSDAEKRSALAATSVWALPSLAEAFGIAVMEALAGGLPTVISPSVNIAPEVEAARAGVVCELTPEAFAREILALVGDPQRREELGARARDFARRFDWGALAPRWIEAYERAAA